jgi:hypothetical protein
MASTYVNDLRLNEMATGDASGSWGTVTNTNLELIGEAFSYGTETIGDADSTLTIADGAADAARSFYLKITSSVDLTTTRIVTLAPNTVSKVWMIENATTGSQVITIKQGSGATINVPNGQVKMISTDGAGSGGAVLDLLVDVDLTGTTTLVNLDVSGAVDIAGDLTLSAGGDGALRFTAASSVKVLDNNAAALVFEEADNAYMTFVTTDGSEAVKFDKALDINAATQIDATVTVGVDDTGYDVKFFGATAGAYMLWDESADTLEVSGTVTADGLTVDGGSASVIRIAGIGQDSNEFSSLEFYNNDGSLDGPQVAGKISMTGNASGVNSSLDFYTALSSTGVEGAAPTKRMTITNTGDISFYEDTSTTAKFYWDSSAESLGIGTSSPNQTLEVAGSSAAIRVNDTDLGTNVYGDILSESGALFTLRSRGGASTHGSIDFRTWNGTNDLSRMHIDSTGNVGIGTSSPNTVIDAQQTSTGASTQIRVYNTDNSNTTTQTAALFLSPDSRGNGALIFAQKENADFSTNAGRDVSLVFSPVLNNSQTEAMRIDSSGNVGIGVSDPSELLEVGGETSNNYIQVSAANNSASGIKFRSDSSNTTGWDVGYEGDGNYLFFRNDVGGAVTERLRIDSSGYLIAPQGITLGTAVGTYAAANTLDDYEEGTWVPVPADASSGGNTGTGTNRGLYTKIGNLVTVTFSITNIDTTGLTAGAVFFLQGLPFAAPSYTSPNMFFMGSVMCDNVTFSGFVSTRIDDNNSSIRFGETSSGGALGSVIVSEISSGSADIYGTVTYQASS